MPARLRSLLFAPASRPDVLAKLPRANPDGVVLDLEDAVPADAKAAARPNARAAGTSLATAHPDMAVYVRVNAVPTEWFAHDVAEGVAPEVSGIIVPKLESPHQIETVVDVLERAGLGHLHLLAGIETAQGVESARELFRSPVRVAYFGAEDYIADMGGVRTPEGTEVLYRVHGSRSPPASVVCSPSTRSSPRSTTRSASSPMPPRGGPSASPGSSASTRRRSPSLTVPSLRAPRRSIAPVGCSRRTTRPPPTARPPSRSRGRWSTNHSRDTPAPCWPIPPVAAPPTRPDGDLP